MSFNIVVESGTSARLLTAGKYCDRDIIVTASGQNKAEIITLAQDGMNVEEAYNMFNAFVSDGDKMVIFINNNWNGVPDDNTPSNKGLCLMWFSEEYQTATVGNKAFWTRWRSGAYATNSYVNASYDFIVSAGEEWQKVVLL